MFLKVEPGGTRRWVQRLAIHGLRRDTGLGGFPLVTLAEARQQALANRKLARADGDPIAVKRQAEVPTFEEAAENVIALHAGNWRDGGKTCAQWRANLRDYAMPRMGRLRVSAITTADVMAVLLPIWHEKCETARRLRQRIGAIMKWVIAQGHRQDNPAGESIAAAHPRNGAVRKHMTALPHGEVAGALAKVRSSAAGTSTKLAFEVLVLSAARSGEVRLATWDEIDLAAAVWTVPAERMKANREHRVPLGERVVEILTDARSVGDGKRLPFPSPRGKALSDMTLSKLVRERAIAAVPHGFRSSFRDWAAEPSNHPGEVVEAALAHVVQNNVEAAYAPSDLFERRRRLMDDCAVYLDAERGQLIPFPR